jgi:putative endonuclease
VCEQSHRRSSDPLYRMGMNLLHLTRRERIDDDPDLANNQALRREFSGQRHGFSREVSPCKPVARNHAKIEATDMLKPWCLYLIECRNGSLYAGITNDLAARYAAHVSGKGARYTRANPPLRLVGFREYPDRSAASRAEYAIRQLPASRKIAFLEQSTTAPPADH